MKLSSQMKNLSEGIISSFKQRIQENEELVIEVQKTLNGFQNDHQDMAALLNANAKALRVKLDKDENNRLKESDILMKKITKDHKDMAAALRSGLDKDEKNRMKEFVALMKNVNDDIKSINDEVLTIFKDTNDLIERFEKEHIEMSVELRADMSKNLTERVEYTRTLLDGFQKRLSEISKENQKMAQKLRKDLTKTEVERLSDYNGIMKEIHVAINGIRKEVKDIQKASAGLIGDFAQDREGASAAWKNMSDILLQLRKTAVMPLPQVARKAQKKEMKMEAPVTVNPKPAVPATLEQKVLIFINNHPKGTKISDMEEPLGENRMKLGFAAKTLLDQDKVQKSDNLYFPKK